MKPLQPRKARTPKWHERNWNKWATVYSDASFAKEKAGVAYHIRFAGVRIVDALQVEAADSLHAELLAIKHGVHRALTESRLDGLEISGFFCPVRLLFRYEDDSRKKTLQ